MTPEWSHVAIWARKEIEVARDALETETKDAQWLRGRIAALRELLRMPDDPKRDPEKVIGDTAPPAADPYYAL